MLKIVSWNINGLRNKLHLIEENFSDYDIICLQETKLIESLIDDMELKGFYVFHSISTKKGYSGVAIYIKKEIKIKNIIKIPDSLNTEPYDTGRIIALDLENFTLINVYVPNAGKNLENLEYKIEIYCKNLFNFIKSLKKSYIITGDFNATKSLDSILEIHKPQNKIAGNTPIEVKWLNYFIDKLELVDIFRYMYPNILKYTFFSYITKARKYNKGWRIDFFLITKSLLDKIIDTDIIDKNITNSDHNPITLKLF